MIDQNPKPVVKRKASDVAAELRDAIAAQNEQAAMSSGVELLGIMTDQIGLMADGLASLVDAVQRLATVNIKVDGKPN